MVVRDQVSRLQARLQEVEARLAELEAGWGDWLRLPPRPEAYLGDPFLDWAWPKVRGEYQALRNERNELLRRLKGVRRAVR